MHQRLVCQQFGIFGKKPRLLGVFDMRLKRDRPFGAQQLHQLADQQDAIEIILFCIARPLEYFGQAAAQRLQLLR